MQAPMFSSVLLRPLVGAAVAVLGVAACNKTVVIHEPAPNAAAAMATTPDSVLALCVRGDTTNLRLRNRDTGLTRDERWVLTPSGTVVDVNSGRIVMDSVEVTRTKYRDVFSRQRQTEGLSCS